MHHLSLVDVHEGQYSDLDAEKLVEKLSCLVLGGIVECLKMGGRRHTIFDGFSDFRKVEISSNMFITINDKNRNFGLTNGNG